MRRRLILISVGVLSVVAVGYLGLWLTAPTRIDPEKMKKVTFRMSLAEVERLVGHPPGRYTSRNDIVLTEFKWREDEKEGSIWWVTDEWSLGLCVDHKDLVTQYTVVKTAPSRESILDKLRRWLGL